MFKTKTELVIEYAKALSWAHETPMNKVHEDHKGRKSLATHSMAWARDGDEVLRIKREIDARGR